MASGRRRAERDDTFYGITNMMRVAMMPRSEQLTLVLDLLRQNLDKLTADQRLALLRALQAVHPLAAKAKHGGQIRWRVSVPPEPMSLDKLRALVTTLGAAIRRFHVDGRWPLPTPSRVALQRSTDDTARAGSWWWVFEPASNADAIMIGVADLVWEHADRVRICDLGGCGALFFAHKGQKFCTPEHGQQFRDRKKANQKKGGK